MGKTSVQWMVCIAVLCAAFCWLAAVPAVAAPPDGKGEHQKSFVYTNANPEGANFIEAFVRDRKTGRLTSLGRTQTDGQGLPFIGGFQQHAIVSVPPTLRAGSIKMKQSRRAAQHLLP